MNPNEKNGTDGKTTFDLYLQHNAEALKGIAIEEHW